MADLICDGIQLAFTFTVGLPGVGIRGFVAGTLVSAAAGALLNGWLVVRYTGLRPSLFRWVTAPGLAALLAALTSNLLFRWLKDSGVSLLAGGAASLLFGGVLYLAALSAQGRLSQPGVPAAEIRRPLQKGPKPSRRAHFSLFPSWKARPTFSPRASIVVIDRIEGDGAQLAGSIFPSSPRMYSSALTLMISPGAAPSPRQS